MKSWLTLLLIGITATAFADDAPPVAAATPAAAAAEIITETLKLFRDQKADDFIAKYCDPIYCGSGNIESLKAYQLKHAQEHAKDCLHEGDTIQITSTQGDWSKDTRMKVFIKCEPDRRPVPVNFMKQADGTWKINGISI